MIALRRMEHERSAGVFSSTDRSNQNEEDQDPQEDRWLQGTEDGS